MDDIVVVAEKELAQFARSMVQAMTLHKYKSVYWTEKHYRDNESTIRGGQKVFFLGENEVSKDYVEILPVKFAAHGVSLRIEGPKAMLQVDNSLAVTGPAVEEMKSTIRKAKEAGLDDAPNESHRASMVKAAVGGGMAGGFISGLGVLVPGAGFVLGYVGFLIIRLVQRRAARRRLQYVYGITLFLRDHCVGFAGEPL